jgi:hypothetical protein
VVGGRGWAGFHVGLVGWGWGRVGLWLALPDTVGGGGSLINLNSNNSFNFLNNLPTDSDIPSPYTQFNINSDYHDECSQSNYLSNSNTPIFLSLTQSLLSKFESIKQLFSALSSLSIHIDILALQETWHIFYTELVQIPGYTFIHQHRSSNRGGGVGFYMKHGFTFTINSELSHFTDNLFESLTIEAKISNKMYILSYHSS